MMMTFIAQGGEGRGKTNDDDDVYDELEKIDARCGGGGTTVTTNSTLPRDRNVTLSASMSRLQTQRSRVQRCRQQRISLT